MKGSRRKKDRPVSSVRRPAYRAEFAPAECCGSGPAMRIELPLGELTGDLQGAVHGLVGQLRAPWRPPIAEEGDSAWSPAGDTKSWSPWATRVGAGEVRRREAAATLSGAPVEDPLRWAAECAGPSAAAAPAALGLASEGGVEQEGLCRGEKGVGGHGQGTLPDRSVGRSQVAIGDLAAAFGNTRKHVDV